MSLTLFTKFKIYFCSEYSNAYRSIGRKSWTIKALKSSQRNSSYAPHFIDPIYKRRELEKLREEGELSKLAHIPIKAAKSEETCSAFYDSALEKFINYVMRSGNKELARQQVNKALETVKRLQVAKYNKANSPDVKETIELNPLTIFHKAVENCKPLLQLTPIKRGGATYQVPVPITEKRATFLAMNWLIEQGNAEPRTIKFYEKLAQELVNASNNQGKVVRRKQELHKQCEANRAFAHYRWG